MAASICIDAPVAAGSVLAVCLDAAHRFSKQRRDTIELIAGHGVRGDAHAGATVQHRSRVAVDPAQPNLRQVHLLHRELYGDLAVAGFDLSPGDLGENIVTSGIDLLALPANTRLRCGSEAVIEITGQRNPCHQIEAFAPGLLAQVARKRADGAIERLAGVMGIVVTGGTVKPGDLVRVELPPLPYIALETV